MVHYISDKIVVMYRGRIVEAGATEAVYRHPLHPYTQTLLASVPQADPIFEQQRPMFSLTMNRLHERQT